MGLEHGRREVCEQNRIEGFQQGYKDGVEHGKKEERQRVIPVLALLEQRTGGSIQIALAPSEYPQLLLGEIN